MGRLTESNLSPIWTANEYILIWKNGNNCLISENDRSIYLKYTFWFRKSVSTNHGMVIRLVSIWIDTIIPCGFFHQFQFILGIDCIDFASYGGEDQVVFQTSQGWDFTGFSIWFGETQALNVKGRNQINAILQSGQPIVSFVIL